jgi:hypothetical protein
MQAALSGLPAVGAVRVSRSGPTTQRGYVWTVTHTALAGNVANFAVSGSTLTGVGKSALYNEVSGKFVNMRLCAQERSTWGVSPPPPHQRRARGR